MGSNPATIASIVVGGPLGLAMAPSVFQAEEAHKARKEARNEMGKQADEQRQLRADLASRQANQESTAAADAARRAGRKRQLALSTSGQSRQDTILTQGLGGGGAPAAAQKTLLGA